MTKIAIYLSGGGARGAYQVGVVKAIAEITQAPSLPFSIICGTSAGAFNAAAMAMNAPNFSRAVQHLESVWASFSPDKIYRTGMRHVFGKLAQFLNVMLLGAKEGVAPRALLDNNPLRQLMTQQIDFQSIASNIERGHLSALSITAANYDSGKSTSFYHCHQQTPDWVRAKRVGIAQAVCLDHLMASAAIPFIFPAVRLQNSYYGDGAIRQFAPLSTAIHLGADKILSIGLKNRHVKEPAPTKDYPQPAKLSAYLLDSLFIDALDSDIERMCQINELLQHNPHPHLRSIDILQLAPSIDINPLAQRYYQDMPASIRFLLHATGGGQSGGLLSYLMFHAPFTQDLIELGYQDALAQSATIAEFLVSS